MTKGLKARVVQEYIPGKQVRPAHVICNPRPELCSLIGVEKSGAIAMDFIDRFTGCVLFTGDVAAVESSLEEADRLRQDESAEGARHLGAGRPQDRGRQLR